MMILECSRKEFGASVRLVAGGKSSGEHDNLSLVYFFFENLHGFSDILRGLIFKYTCYYIGSGSLKCLLAVIFTVGSRKYRYEYGGLCHFMPADIDLVRSVHPGFHRLRTLMSLCGEHFLQPGLPCIKRLFHGNSDIMPCEGFFRFHLSDYPEIQIPGFVIFLFQ